MEEGGVQVISQGSVVYSQDEPSMSNFIPSKVDDYIDMLEFTDQGQLFIGTSSLNKRSWTGDLWWFGCPEDAPERDKAKTGLRLDCGIVKGKVVGSKQILVGLDSGGIQLLSASSRKDVSKEDPVHQLELHPSLCEHDDQLTDMDTWKEGENHLVTVSREGRIVVWNPQYIVRQNYHPAHSSEILSVSCHPTNNHMFATAGQDGKIKVWDTREKKPCRTVYSDPHVPASSLAWYPDQPDTLLVTSATGTVFNLSVGSRAVSAHLAVSDKTIRNIRWNPKNPQEVAVCGDDVTVSVLTCHQGEIALKYTNNNSHSDYVRGLAWNPVDGRLWSGGWDKRVIVHTV